MSSLLLICVLFPIIESVGIWSSTMQSKMNTATTNWQGDLTAIKWPSDHETTDYCPNDSKCWALQGEHSIYRSISTKGYNHISFTFSIEVTTPSSGTSGCYLYYNINNADNSYWQSFWNNKTDGTVLIGHTIQLPQATWDNIGVGIRIRDTTNDFPDGCHISHFSLNGNLITPSPTPAPTNNPIPAPTAHPTTQPTPSPTNNPTPSPTSVPTSTPTKNPITPSPTFPGTLFCGDSIQGAYNDETLTFYVEIQHSGDLIFNASMSNFEVVNIEGYTVLGTIPIAHDTNNDEILTLYHIPAGTYRFLLGANIGISGTFIVQIHCPTNAPTTVPTDGPTMNPTYNPTYNPIPGATYNPTQLPTKSPVDLTPKTTSETDEFNTELLYNNQLYILLAAALGLTCCCALLLIIAYFRRSKKKEVVEQVVKSNQLHRHTVEMHSPTSVTGNTFEVTSAVTGNTLESWLKEMDLMEHYETFRKNGFELFESRLYLDDSSLKEMGVSKLGHRKLILHQVQKDIKNTQKIEKYVGEIDIVVPMIDNVHEHTPNESSFSSSRRNIINLFGSAPGVTANTMGEGKL